MRKLVFFIALIIFMQSNSQELNCLVNINYEQIGGSNRQVFKTLETALKEFINQTKWTNRVVKSEERIDCAISELDLDKRKVNLSIKLLEEIEKKEALEKYGAEGSGKNLPFSSLSEKLEKKEKKTK